MLPGETVVILTPATATDPFSNQSISDWSVPPGRQPVDNVLVEPRPSGEPEQDARNQVTSGFTLYFQSTPPVYVTAQHRVEVRGNTYDVLGSPADWRLGSWTGDWIVQCERSVG
jgi:hypothetical protein